MSEGFKDIFTGYVFSGIFRGYSVAAQAEEHDARRIKLEMMLREQEDKLDRLCAEAKKADVNIDRFTRNLGQKTPQELKETAKTFMQQLGIQEIQIIGLRKNRLSSEERQELAKAMLRIQRLCDDFYESTVGTTADLNSKLQDLLVELSTDSSDPAEHALAVRSESPTRYPSEPSTPTPTARQGSLREQQEAAFRARTQSGLPRAQLSSSGSLDNIGPGAPLAPFSLLTLVPFKSTQETSILTLIRVNAPHLATGDMRRRWGNSGAQC